jgi:hypothetical protein
MTILTYGEAKAQAEQALANLAALDQPGQENSNEPVSCDRECPNCGLVQPDDDSTDCWACGAILDPDDIDPELPDELRCSVCGKEANVFFTNGERLCWDHLKERAESEAEREKRS